MSKKSKKRSYTIRDAFKKLSEIRSEILNDPIAKDIASELNDDSDNFLKCVSISFGELDVSAKTWNGNVILNHKLMDKPFPIMMRYVVHELTHAVQHILNNGSQNSKSKGDYLGKDTEVEAFQRQVEYHAENVSDKDAEKYVDELLAYHDTPKSKREDMREELLERVAATNKKS
jgi:hypothetical protein